MRPQCSKAIRELHALLQQVAAKVADIRPLLEEESAQRKEIAQLLDDRVEAGDPCPATEAADLKASLSADMWASEVDDAIASLSEPAPCTDFLDALAKEAELAAFMLANRSTVFGLFSDDDTRVFELAGMARNALPDAPKYALDATARAVLALPADVAYPVEVANG